MPDSSIWTIIKTLAPGIQTTSVLGAESSEVPGWWREIDSKAEELELQIEKWVGLEPEEGGQAHTTFLCKPLNKQKQKGRKEGAIFVAAASAFVSFW